jgi:hypothetical protein
MFRECSHQFGEFPEPSRKGADIEFVEMCFLAYEFPNFGTFHTSGEERILKKERLITGNI